MKAAWFVAVLVLALGGNSWGKGEADPCQPQPFCIKQPPTPVPPLWMAGRCNRCTDIPVDLLTLRCAPGEVVVCETRPPVPAIAQCPNVTFGVCVPGVPVEGTVTPNFQVLFVAYSPPGRGSSVSYAAGTTLGTNIEIVKSWSNSTDLGVAVGAGVVVASGKLEVIGNATFGGKTTIHNEVGFEQSETFRVPGQGDGVDHNWDQIWFMVRPSIQLKVFPGSGPPYNTPARVSWQYKNGQQVQTFWVYVGELVGAFPLPPDIQAQLEAWGITQGAYAELLKADPFVSSTTSIIQQPDGRYVEIAYPPGYMDPTRFELIEALPYRPLGAPNEQPTTTTYSVKKSTNNWVQPEATQSYGVTAEYSASINVIIAQARWNVKDKFVFTTGTSTRLTTMTNTTDALTVGQPSFGYRGPVVLYVYEDRMWHTYAFSLEEKR